MTGHAAFERRSGEKVVAQFLRITSQPIPDLREQGLPADVAAAIERAMARDPADSSRERGGVRRASFARFSAASGGRRRDGPPVELGVEQPQGAGSAVGPSAGHVGDADAARPRRRSTVRRSDSGRWLLATG